MIAKEETIKLINIASGKVSAEATAMDLAQSVVGVASQLTELPTKPSIELIKKEIAKEF